MPPPPTRYPAEVTPQRLAVALVALWALCCLLAGLPLLGWGHYRFQPQTVPICNPVWVTEVGFALFLMLGGLGLPFLVMLAAYVRIVQIAKRHIAKIEAAAQVGLAASSRLQGFQDFQDSCRDFGRDSRCDDGGVFIIPPVAVVVVQGGGGNVKAGAAATPLSGFRVRVPDGRGVISSPGGVDGGFKLDATELPTASGSVNIRSAAAVQQHGASSHQEAEEAEVKKQSGKLNGCAKKGDSRSRNPPEVMVTSQAATSLKATASKTASDSPMTSRTATRRPTLVVTSSVPSNPGMTVETPPVAPTVTLQAHAMSSLAVASYLSPAERATPLKRKSVTRSWSITGFASKRVFSKSVKTANRVFVAVGE